LASKSPIVREAIARHTGEAEDSVTAFNALYLYPAGQEGLVRFVESL